MNIEPYLKAIKKRLKSSKKKLANYRKKKPKRYKAWVIFGATSLLIFIWIVISFSIATWYRISHADEKLTWGFSWSSKYAWELGVDAVEGMDRVAAELPFERVRLMSYWDVHERERDQYDWYFLDKQIDIAEKHGLDVSLSIGLRQPRWPECHWPHWAQELPNREWRDELNQFMLDVIDRYDGRAVIAEYQLENEFLLKAFGECPDFDRDRLIEEYDVVNAATDKKITISRSNNALGWPVGDPVPDAYSLSVYKRVFDSTITHSYIDYPFPAWMYGFLAGISEITQGKDDFFIHELQAEPWGPTATVFLTLDEQAKSMDAARLRDRLDYAHRTGIRTIDIWGAEWAYWRMDKFNDDSIWNTYVTELPDYE